MKQELLDLIFDLETEAVTSKVNNEEEIAIIYFNIAKKLKLIIKKGSL